MRYLNGLRRKPRIFLSYVLIFLLLIVFITLPISTWAQSPSPSPSVSTVPSPTATLIPPTSFSPAPAPPSSTPLVNTYIPPVIYAAPPQGTPLWSGQNGQAPASPSTGAGSIPPEITQYAKDWPLANHDYSNTRATKDSKINSTNVSQLKPSWSTPLSGQQLSTTPIIMGNNVYIEDRTYNTHAVDLQTGKVKWSTQYDNPEWQGPNGVTLAYGKLFTNKDLYTQAALDPATGAKLWTTKLSIFKWIYSNIQPIPYDNTLFTTVTGHVAFPDSGSVNGVFYALDQQNGTIKWALSGVDSPETWGHPEINAGGGAWMPPAIDTNTGITYWGTKNPGNGVGPNGPYSGTKEFPNGSSRPGPNLYTNCMISVDRTNGKILWYNSAFPHDLADHDFQNSPILAGANINGSQTDIVIGSGKGGIVIAYDRKTGKELWRTPVGKHQNDDLKKLPDTGIEVFPGLLGGLETMCAYADGLVFAPYCDLGTLYSSMGEMGMDPFQSGSGGLAAIDVNTGKIVWDNKLPSLNFGSATVANDVVFTATYEGVIYAFEAKTGKQLWTYRVTSGINGWPAIVGDMLIWPCGAIGTPQLIAFKLGQ
jgi:outer membrane protein assembly factor BamB